MKVKFVAVVALAAVIAFGVMTATAQSGAVLRIDSVKITKTDCGKPLEFQIVIKNTGSSAFIKSMVILIKNGTNPIAHQFVTNIPAGQAITDVQSSLNAAFLADCCKEVCFEVSLASSQSGAELPEWNKVPFKLCTKPGNVIVVPGR